MTVQTQPVLECAGLTRMFGGLCAVDKVDLAVAGGSVHAVIGTNGAGKSTLLNMLAGELAPSRGVIRLRGEPITHLSQPHRARAGVGRTYQRNTLFEELSVYENIRLAGQSLMQAPWKVFTCADTCGETNGRALRAARLAGLEDVLRTPARVLSHGQKRQLEIAMCLAHEPSVLLLDEPLAGMGPQESERMLALLVSLKADHAIVLVEHDMSAVFQVADRVTVMVNGAVIASDEPEGIRRHPAVIAAYLGDEHAAE